MEQLQVINGGYHAVDRRTNLISDHDAINNHSVTRELFFEVSPV